MALTARRSLSHLEMDSRSRDLPSEIMSKASSDQELSNPLLDAGEGLLSCHPLVRKVIQHHHPSIIRKICSILLQDRQISQ